MLGEVDAILRKVASENVVTDPFVAFALDQGA